MDVVQERSAFGLFWQAVEIDVKRDACAILVGSPCDIATNGGSIAGREHGGVGHARGIVVNHGSGTGKCGG